MTDSTDEPSKFHDELEIGLFFFKESMNSLADLLNEDHDFGVDTGTLIYYNVYTEKFLLRKNIFRMLKPFKSNVPSHCILIDYL